MMILSFSLAFATTTCERSSPPPCSFFFSFIHLSKNHNSRKRKRQAGQNCIRSSSPQFRPAAPRSLKYTHVFFNFFLRAKKPQPSWALSLVWFHCHQSLTTINITIHTHAQFQFRTTFTTMPSYSPCTHTYLHSCIARCVHSNSHDARVCIHSAVL